MEKAIKLMKLADPYPNPKVGAIIVKNGKIVGKGYHKKAGDDHAEIIAMKQAGKKANGATLYVTLEPCSHKKKRTPPCTDAIIKSGIAKVVFGMKDPNPKVNGAYVLKKAGIRVIGPTNNETIKAINSEYLDTYDCFIALKMAMSLDGKTATKTGDSKWISNTKSRKIVHKMRSEFDAVMIGANTLIKDNPKLTSRTKKDPIKIIVDGSLRINANAQVFKNKSIVVTTTNANEEKLSTIEKKASVIQFVQAIDFRLLIRILSKLGIKKILVEGGSELNSSILPFVKKIYLFVAPIVIGGRDSLGVIGGNGISNIENAKKARNLKVTRIEQDLLLEFDV